MEIIQLSPNMAICISTVLFICLFSLLWTRRTAGSCGNSATKGIAPPEAAGSWPLLGHLPKLGGQKLLHIVLGTMADEYGPIFTIKLGCHRALVVSDPELAKECFTTNDRAFATRPKSMAVELMGYNYALFGFGPYGSYWRHVRKIVMLELLSSRRVEMFGHSRFSEVKAAVRELQELCASTPARVEMKRWFGDLNMNIIVRMLAGKRYQKEEKGEGVRFQKAMREFFEYEGTFVPSDFLPFLRWMDWGGLEKEMKRIAKELDGILEGWLAEHKRRREEGGGKGEDFIDLMMSRLEGVNAEEFGGRDADTVNKSTCLAILSGGTETTTVSLTWALSLLLNNRHVLKKAQDEVDIHVGRQRNVEESDLNNLVYLQAIIKETLRLYPAVPVLSPHEALEDCTVRGHRVAAGTRLVVNCWKIHRDPRVWSNPEEFKPERFLTEDKGMVDVRGQHFELIPFGSGRRMCPGVSLTLQVMQLTLAYLLHGFDLKTPSDEPVDMTEAPGLTNLKATPLEVVASPRLPGHLY